MKKLLRNTVLITAGLAFLMRDQIKEAVVKGKNGQLKFTGDEGKQKLNEFVEKSKTTASKFASDVSAKLSGVVDNSPLATKKDLTKMEKNIKKELKK